LRVTLDQLSHFWKENTSKAAYLTNHLWRRPLESGAAHEIERRHPPPGISFPSRQPKASINFPFPCRAIVNVLDDAPLNKEMKTVGMHCYAVVLVPAGEAVWTFAKELIFATGAPKIILV
jgi:hypothetical protein